MVFSVVGLILVVVLFAGCCLEAKYLGFLSIPFGFVCALGSGVSFKFTFEFGVSAWDVGVSINNITIDLGDVSSKSLVAATTSARFCIALGDDSKQSFAEAEAISAGGVAEAVSVGIDVGVLVIMGDDEDCSLFDAVSIVIGLS